MPLRQNAMRVICFAIYLTLICTFSDARSPSEVRKFRAEHPCPSTGKIRGACPGWQVDHKIPLKCHGDDNPRNMQWLTIAQHKKKTRREARWCRGRAVFVGEGK